MDMSEELTGPAASPAIQPNVDGEELTAVEEEVVEAVADAVVDEEDDAEFPVDDGEEELVVDEE